MNAVLAQKDLPAAIGAAFEGGSFFGAIMVDRNPHAIIVSPKAAGSHAETRWNKNLKRVGAISYSDSFLNTVAMAEAGSPIAQWARAQEINGLRDWCIPARDLLERMYFLGKPTTRRNACWFRDGENPSAIPPAYPYTAMLPAQTDLDAFREGGVEAFDPAYYWSSTEYEADSDYAYAQDFGDGGQGNHRKDSEFAVRLVRTIPI